MVYNTRNSKEDLSTYVDRFISLYGGKVKPFIKLANLIDYKGKVIRVAKSIPRKYPNQDPYWGFALSSLSREVDANYLYLLDDEGGIVYTLLIPSKELPENNTLAIRVNDIDKVRCYLIDGVEDVNRILTV